MGPYRKLLIPGPTRKMKSVEQWFDSLVPEVVGQDLLPFESEGSLVILNVGVARTSRVHNLAKFLGTTEQALRRLGILTNKHIIWSGTIEFTADSDDTISVGLWEHIETDEIEEVA